MFLLLFLELIDNSQYKILILQLSVEKCLEKSLKKSLAIIKWSKVNPFSLSSLPKIKILKL